MRKAKDRAAAETAQGACLCGAVALEIDLPAFWAWHDHSAESRKAQGCAYATYVGTYRSRFRFTAGEGEVTRYEQAPGTFRSFCRRCGAPVAFERARAPAWINLPRALFDGRTGREPRYHLNLHEAAEWTWRGEPLSPLKGYPGVLRERPRRKKAAALDPML